MNTPVANRVLIAIGYLVTLLPYLPKTDIVLQLEFFFNGRRYHWFDPQWKQTVLVT